jgi:replication factor C subunit 1
MDSPIASTPKKPRLEFEPSPSKRKLEFKNDLAPKSEAKTEPAPKPAVKTEPTAAKREAKPSASSKTEPSPESKTKPNAETPAEPKQKPRGNPKWFGSRPAPPNKGLKPLPTGEEGCLVGKQFIVSGILDSLERDEVHDLIKSFGGYLLLLSLIFSTVSILNQI